MTSLDVLGEEADAQAMRIAAKDMNDAIQKDPRDDPKLKQRYDVVVRSAKGDLVARVAD